MTGALRFGFYARFPAPWTQAYQVEDKIFVERHFAPGSQVVIHYQLRGEGAGKTPAGSANL